MKDADPSFHITEDTCTDIVAGLLTTSDTNRILDHVRNCPACETTFREHVTDFELFRASSFARVPTAVAHRERQRFSWRLIPRPAWVVAAAVVLLIVLLPRLQTSPVPPPQYWIPSDREFVEVRSQGHTANEAFYAGVRAYRAKDVDGAAGLLAGAQVSGSYEVLRDVYLASALTLTGRHREALTITGDVDAKRLPQPWRSEIRWIHYIALVGSGMDADATALLDELSALDDEVGEMARARKKQLK